MAQSSTGSKAFEVEDDADVEIAGCSGCAEPLRWRAGTEFMNESACLKSACDTRSVSWNMLSLSQCIVLLWHGHQQMVGAILVSSWSPPFAEEFRTGSGSLLETQVATRLWCEKCKQSRFIVLRVGHAENLEADSYMTCDLACWKINQKKQWSVRVQTGVAPAECGGISNLSPVGGQDWMKSTDRSGIGCCNIVAFLFIYLDLYVRLPRIIAKSR